MSRSLEPNPPEVELLLAAERQLVPEPDDLCDSAVERARAALPRKPHARLASRAPRLRHSRIGLSAAAAVLLFAVCATAFLAGYRIKTEESAKPIARASLPLHTLPLSAPVALSVSPLGPPPEPVLRGPRAGRVGPAAARKAAADIEGEVVELHVLRPAQQAISREDFASALAAVAEHQRRFPWGQLAEEREALRVKALLGLGRMSEAQRAGAAFRQRFAHSALLERIDEMLETPR
jgi:hypothetical protein